MARPGFWNPCLDSSGSEDESDPLSTKNKKTKAPMKKTRTNQDAIKNPADILSDQDEVKSVYSDDEEIISVRVSKGRSRRIASEDAEDDLGDPLNDNMDEDSSPPQKSPRKRPAVHKSSKSKSKKKRKSDSEEDDFDPGSDGTDESGEETEDEIPEDNISDSDFMPGKNRGVRLL